MPFSVRTNLADEGSIPFAGLTRGLSLRSIGGRKRSPGSGQDGSNLEIPPLDRLTPHKAKNLKAVSKILCCLSGV